jgi:type IV pilus assembly protein PilB
MASELAKHLYKHGAMDRVTIKLIEGNALQDGLSFFEQALKEDNIQMEPVLQAIAELEKMPVVDIDRINIDNLPLDLLPDKMMEEYQILPLSQHNNRIFVAIGNPDNKVALAQALSQARFHTNLTVSPVICNPVSLNRVTRIAAASKPAAGVGTLGDIPDNINLDEMAIIEDDLGDDFSGVDLDTSSPIVQYVNKTLRDAINMGASDIHIEPYEVKARIRYRVDGVLIDGSEPPLRLVQNIVSRIKVLARLDIAERRLPQDGRIKIQFSRSRTIDFRVSTMPTIFGEKVVLRILDQGATHLNLETLGMEHEQLLLYQQATAQPHGMILVTGPTGSGKTVTLYSALAILNTPETNISSVEDPVEIYTDGINQVSINEKTGLTFARTLRAFLRQDPDVLMVGEIRDLETADIAIKAAQTGHLVLSTLHTNDAPSAVTRLLNMGVAPFNIASTLNLVIAQRLVRRLCSVCKKPMKLPIAVMLEAGFTDHQIKNSDLYEPVGCRSCTRGYRGRTGIYEMMPLSSETAELIMQKATETEISRQVRTEGTLTLKEEGIKKVSAGITSLAEVERVTKG